MEGASQDEKIIVITGVTVGLGLAMAKYFEDLSHVVIGCGRTQSKISSLNGNMQQNRFFVVDVSKDAEVAEWAKYVQRIFGPPDILINNAAIVNHNANLWEIPADEFDNVIDVNIKGTANCIRHFLPCMIEAGKGVVVNFSSTWGKSVSGEVAPYCCSKWGIEGLSKSLALELPPPLACVPLNPGVINTEMLQKIFGISANSSPTPQQWVKRAGPLILSINREMNGKSLNAQW